MRACPAQARSETTVDYYKLNDKLSNIALTEKGTEVVVRDNTGKHMRQEYYAFADGFFYCYDVLRKAALRLSDFECEIDTAVGSHHYMIALGYREDWYPGISFVSYSNDIQSPGNDSLLQGVSLGVVSAFRKYMKVQMGNIHKLKSIRLKNGLMVACCVKGSDLVYYGATKEKLDDPVVKKGARSITIKHLYAYLCKNPAIAEKILARMDEANILNKMWDRPTY